MNDYQYFETRERKDNTIYIVAIIILIAAAIGFYIWSR